MEKKKKLLFLMPSLGGGGAEKVLMTILLHFDYSRFEVDLCVISRSGIYFDDLPSNVHVFCVYDNPVSWDARMGFYLYSKFHITFFERLSITRALRGKKYETIISFCEGRTLKFHGYILNLGKRNVSWVHCDLFTSHYTIGPVLSSKDEKHIYERMDEVVFVSEEARSQFLKFGYKLQSASVIFNPIDVVDIQKYKREFVSGKETMTITLCGRLMAQKAFDRIVRVASHLRNDGYSFVVKIYGQGEDEFMLRSLIEELGLQSIVFLMGFVRPVYPELAQADIFVSVSRYEGYPTNLCEAFSLGLPIVATRCCGNTELIGEQNENGILVEQDDDAIYRGIKHMMDNEDMRREYAIRSFRKSNDFDIPRTMSEIYRHL